MSDLAIELDWKRAEPALQPGAYDNAHAVRFAPAQALTMDAAPDWRGDPGNANPEQALAAALSSCHMMTFLALAAKAAWPVASYRDRAVAELGRDGQGRMTVRRIDLRPEVGFDPGFAPDGAELRKMHHRAHRYCFIAAALADGVEINIL